MLPSDVVAQSNVQISLDDWIEGGANNPGVVCDLVCGPNGAGEPGAGFCSFDVQVDDPGSGLAYLNVQLDYGLAMEGLDANPCDDGLLDLYELGPEDPRFGGFDALVSGTTDVGIANCTDYLFAHSDGSVTLEDSVQNLSFVPEPGMLRLLVGGLCGLLVLNSRRRRGYAGRYKS